MTVTFPRTLPAGYTFARSNFRLAGREAINETRGGASTALELADPRWEWSAETQPLHPADRAAWQSWAASLRSVRTFYAYDPDKIYPFAYGVTVLTLTRYGGGAFDGTCTVSSTSANTISLTGLPANFQFSIGDHVSIPMTNSQRSLHIVREVVLGNSDGTVTITVDPPVRSGAQTTSGGVQLVYPSCIMLLRPNTFSAPADGELQPASFEAVQVLA